MGSFVATSIQEVLNLLHENPSLNIYGGGTDLFVDQSAQEHDHYVFIHQIRELKQIHEDEKYLRIGAGCTFSEVYEDLRTPDILREAISELAAPAIRNFGTIGGNIGNGSAKADTSLIFFLFDAIIVLMSKNGTREVKIKEFYLGRKKLDIYENEMITEVLIPKKNYGEYYYKKIGARKALAISRLDWGGIYRISQGKLEHFAIAIGAITPVIIREPEVDQKMIGATKEDFNFRKEELLKEYNQIINPIDGRVSANYRKKVSINLLQDFLESVEKQLYGPIAG